ncbi:GNAT family N-acetyltransferase [Anderseniella sp. Alg231-50]|uniref:GNAT family N-acetyltransferase n=1 Tax=Anderseniella sp. Alg231-50 TaxID=1922226 RepID=UPI00307B3873
MKNLSIRKCGDDDVCETAQIFYDAVRQGAAGYYDADQRAAWAEKVPETDQWRDRLFKQQTFVAQLDTRLAGFMTLDAGGHIDLAFVAPDLIGKGIARALYEKVEAEALRLDIRRLDTEASHMARRFFERQGWWVVRQQSVQMGDVSLTNFVMEKRLAR